MANVQIPNLPAVIAATGSDLVEAVQSGTSVKVSLSQIATYIQGAIPLGVTSVATQSPLTGGPITSTGTIGLATGGVSNTYLATMPALTIKANTSGSTAAASDRTLTQVLDATAGSSQGSIVYRTSTGWSALALGTSGQVLTSSGGNTVWATPAYTGTVTSVAASGGTTGLSFSGGPITTSGTLTLSGTLSASNGGTGLSSYTIGDLIYASGASTIAALADVATGNALISGGIGAAPSYGKIGLTTHVSGTLPIANGGTGQTAKAAAFNAISPVTSTGDLIVGNGVNSNTRLGIGTTSQVLTVSGGTAVWADLPATGTVTSIDASGGTTGLTFSGGPVTTSGTITISGTLAIANGGTGQTTKSAAFNALSPMTAVGDLILGGASGAGTRLPIGASGRVLTSDGTTASWVTPASGTVTSVDASGGTTGLTFSGGPVTTAGTLTIAGTLAIANGGTGQTTKSAAFNALSPVTSTGDLILGNGVNSNTRLGIGTTGQVLTVSGGTAAWAAPATSGTVTSVDASGGTTGLSFSGGPITSSGTLTLSGTLAVANGGTGLTSYAIGDVLYASAAGTIAKLADVATGNALISGGVGVAPSYGKIGLTTHVTGTLAIANGGTGQTTKTAAFDALSPMTTAGDLILGGVSGTGGRLGIGTSGQVLTVSGGTAVWAAPATSGTVTSVNVSGGTTGITFSGGPVTTSGTITMAGTLGVANGGTGAATLTGYVKGSGTSAFTASSTIPNTDITGLGSIATQSSVSLTTQATGTLQAAQAPGFTGGDVTSSAGSLALTIAANAVTNAKLATMATATVKANITTSSAVPTDVVFPTFLGNLWGYTETATAGGTTTLTSTSTYYQVFTGSTTQTVVTPTAANVVQGFTYRIVNRSTGALTVNANSGANICTIPAGENWSLTCVNASGAGANAWFAAQITGSAVDVQAFTTSGAGTWTKPTSFTPKTVKVLLWGGGGGGGAGASLATATVAKGGGGGGGGAFNERIFLASDLGATESLSVGAGGTAGAAGAAGAAGGAGGAGGNSTFGSSVYVAAYGGGGGAGGAISAAATGGGGGGGTAGAGGVGSTTGGTGGAPGTAAATGVVAGTGSSGTSTVITTACAEFGGGGGGGSTNAPASSVGGSSLRGGGGGGSGGHHNATPAVVAAADGGASNSYTGGGGGTAGGTGAAGTAGASGSTKIGGAGGGGGGATVTASATGGAGGAGGAYGGGGGGGGVGMNPGLGGAGGAGGVGAIIVISW